jgi:hypothetical protein
MGTTRSLYVTHDMGHWMYIRGPGASEAKTTSKYQTQYKQYANIVRLGSKGMF